MGETVEIDRAHLGPIRDKYESLLLGLPGVHCVAMGSKKVGEAFTGQAAIVCFVEKKVDLASLAPEARIPRELDGVPTDVIQAERPGKIPALIEPGGLREIASDCPIGDLSTYIRPLVGGIQIKMMVGPGVGTGTLGFIANNVSGQACAVSNQHLMGDSGNTIYQPDMTNQKNNKIGTVADSALTPELDAAYVVISGATSSPGVMVCRAQKFTPIGVTGSFSPNVVNWPVWKTGRTTGTTFFKIRALGASGLDSRGRYFRDQLAVETNRPGDRLAGPGDSGSAIMDYDYHVVGLLWSVGPDGEWGYANPIQAVLNRFNLTVATPDTLAVKEVHSAPSVESLVMTALQNLKATAHGRSIAAFVETHGPAVRELIENNDHVAVVWNRIGGHQICTAIVANLLAQECPLPQKAGSMDTREAFEAFGKVLNERAQPELAASAMALRDDLEWLLGRSYQEAFPNS